MKKQQPKYALHKATGQARVRINGKSIYLGEYGSEESRRRYDEIVTEYMKGTLNVSYHKLTIAQLGIAYVKHAKSYYVKNGRITSEVPNIQVALMASSVLQRARDTRSSSVSSWCRSCSASRDKETDCKMSSIVSGSRKPLRRASAQAMR